MFSILSCPWSQSAAKVPACMYAAIYIVRGIFDVQHWDKSDFERAGISFLYRTPTEAYYFLKTQKHDNICLFYENIFLW